MYMTVNSAESKDRVFLCQLLVVLALAESMDASRQPAINQLSDAGATPDGVHVNTDASSTSPPGKEFFEQALALFNVPYENGSIEHIEILNMVRQSVYHDNSFSSCVLNDAIDTVTSNQQVGNAKVFGFEKDLDLYGNRFGTWIAKRSDIAADFAGKFAPDDTWNLNCLGTLPKIER